MGAGWGVGPVHDPPAMVAMSPAWTATPNESPDLAATSRTRQLPVSAMNRSPTAFSTIPVGASSSASTALCPSPLNPGDPVPATVTAPAAWA